MKTCAALLTALLFLAGCSQQNGVHRANLIGTHDLVLVGDVDGGFLATLSEGT